MPDNPEAICSGCRGTRRCPWCDGGIVHRLHDRDAWCQMCGGTDECQECGGTGERPE